jgi:Skp family chaperone for outer membrane proteins
LEEERETLLEKQTSESVVLEELFQARQEETQALRADLEEVTTKLAPLVEARSTAAAQLTTAQTAVQLVTSKAQQATKQCDAAKTELAQLDQHQQEQQDLLAKVQKDLEEFVSRRQELQEEDKMLVDKESKVARKHQTLVVCRLVSLSRQDAASWLTVLCVCRTGSCRRGKGCLGCVGRPKQV